METNAPPPSSQDPTPAPAPPAQPLSARPTASPPPSKETIFRRLGAYPFDSDPSYQSGLVDVILQAQCFYFARKFGLGPIDVNEYKAFLAAANPPTSSSPAPPGNRTDLLSKPDPIRRPSAPTPSTAAAATATSASTVQPGRPPQTITSSSPSPPLNPTNDPPGPAAADDPPPPYPTSFAHIVELITQNKPIPGVEHIPDTVLEQGSSRQDLTVRRQKPWEKTPASAPAPAPEPSSETTTSRDIDAPPTPTSHEEEGLLRLLQPGAVPDSGLLSRD